MPITSRHPTERDIPELNRLIWDAKSSWGYPMDWLETKRGELEVDPDALRRGHGAITLDGRVPIAFYLLLPGEPDWALEHLWVHPTHQGGGVGTRLLKEALQIAAQAGRPGLRIDADPNAAPFYFRHGAQRRGEIPAPLPSDPHRVRPQLWLPTPPPYPSEEELQARTAS